jgi:hypothetical protein
VLFRSTSISNYTISNLQPNTQYFWRVRASDGTNWGLYSEVWSFTTNALENFNLTSPSNGSINQVYSSLILNWTDNIGAINYQIEIDTTNDFSTSPLNYTSSVSAYTVSLAPLKTYYWRVRASNGTIWGQWTNTWSFTTKSDPSVSINELDFTNFSIFPNPASETITIKIPDGNNGCNSCSLIDASGSEIKQIKLTGSETQIDISDLNPGIYFVKVGDWVEKVVVE